MSYDKRFVITIIRSLWTLTGTSAAQLPMCLSNFKAKWYFKLPTSRLRDFTRSYYKTSYRILRLSQYSMLVCMYFIPHISILGISWVDGVGEVSQTTNLTVFPGSPELQQIDETDNYITEYWHLKRMKSNPMCISSIQGSMLIVFIHTYKWLYFIARQDPGCCQALMH